MLVAVPGPLDSFGGFFVAPEVIVPSSRWETS
jgi:hypothetical protein